MIEDKKQRLDQWLVFARFVKTRNLAANIISHGKLRINGKAVIKSHHRIQIGNEISFIHLDRLYHIKVLSLPQKRISPSEKESVFEYLDDILFIGDEKAIQHRIFSKVNVHKGKSEYSRKQNQEARKIKYKIP